ncbi:MAG TPA: HEAT repeat domain-containing protein [Planctomycetota bacterium]|nr:HEAT repeat domain-containing protein [Planctomycetota bacterium]
MNTLALVVLCLAPALQDGWQDTHRVHLRNGNFLDGRLVQIGDKDILFRWNPGVLLRIKIGDIKGDIEEIKIRTLNAPTSKVAVKETAPEPAGVTDVPLPRDPAKPQSAIDKIFTRLMAQSDMTYEILVREVKALGPDGARAMIQELPFMDAAKTNLALVALDQMRELSLEAEIRELLASKRSDLRAAACAILANRGATSSIRAVQSLLRDPVPQVRAAALTALPIFSDGSVLESVGNLAIDPAEPVRERAIRSAEDLASRTSADNDLARQWLSLAGRGPAGSASGIAASLGRLADRANEAFPAGEVRDYLRGMLTDRDPAARAAAAYALSGLKPPGPSADALLEVFDTERESKVVVSMCDGLARLKVIKTLEPLLGKLRADSPEVRTAAQRALEKISGQTGFESDYDKWKEWLDKSRGRNP